MDNKSLNNDTQIEIERFVRNQFTDYISKNKNNSLVLGLDIQKVLVYYISSNLIDTI